MGLKAVDDVRTRDCHYAYAAELSQDGPSRADRLSLSLVSISRNIFEADIAQFVCPRVHAARGSDESINQLIASPGGG